MKIKNTILMFVTLLFISYSCVDLDLLDSPNNLSKDQVDINYLLNGVEESFPLMYLGDALNGTGGLNQGALEVSRMISLFGAYTGGFSQLTATSVDQPWDNAYMGVLKNAKTVIEQADEEGLPYHAGMARVLTAFTLVSLTDCFVSVPYTEAFQGADNFNPTGDSGQDLYNSALALLDAATANFNETALSVPNDYFYGNDASKWIKMINTLKLRMHLTMRKVNSSASKSAIDAIISSGNYIKDISDDFQWTYSSIAANPDSRHPDYKNNYSVGGANDYIANYFIYNLLYDKELLRDPRLRYYLYRQVKEEPSGDYLECAGKANFDYCYVGEYYWGRDHGDDDGVPADGFFRTTYGVYPVGGAFDNEDFQNVTENTGAGGAGIFPILLSSFSNFYLAEAALTLGTAGDAKTYLEAGIRQSIKKVMDFGAAQAGKSSFIPTQETIDAYVAQVLAKYDAAANNEAKLDVVIKEFHIASWGNGMENYNNYRRTGYPSDIQAHVYTPGSFPRSYQYPARLIQRNTSFSQKLVTEPVFWDDNSTTLH